MSDDQPPSGKAAMDRFVRGLVAEDFSSCLPFLDFIDQQPDGSKEFANAIERAKAAWAKEVVNELGNYLEGRYGESRARNFYRLALDAGIDVRLNFANLLSRTAADWDQAQRLYKEVISDGDIDGLNNLAQLLTNRGDMVEAESTYQRAVEAGDSLARKNYALFLIEGGRLADAETELRQLATERPNEGLPRLAALLAAAERWSEARDVVRHMKEAGVRVPATLLPVLGDPDKQKAGVIHRAFGHTARDVFGAWRFRNRLAKSRRQDRTT